ncbi:alkaline phosphatase D family protein [Actinopolymorpha sp. B17G11]|uniref:alkaline phosphatase D family protein n=1 Tax=Actinopolymorpha sp. B17G11 TaxID=3160861 RepID=UPI0032E50530
MASRRLTSSRRQFVAMASGGALTLALTAAMTSSSRAWASPRFPSNPFTLGVASGDPRPDGVVLWTRLAPEPTSLDGMGGMPDSVVPVNWQVAEDSLFRRVVRAGGAEATPHLGHSIHVEVSGLRPDREYWYRFRTGDYVSSTGRTRTAPAIDAVLSSLSFAFASCQNVPEGHFTALRHMSRDDLDFVVHLGDYIYEGGAQGSIGRGHLPAREVFSLADYRVRFGQYKLDSDLQAAHAAFPWIVTLDDHDVENNWAGSHSQPDSEPDQDPEVFLQRRAAAFQAFYENQPLRLASRPEGPDMQLYRRLSFGQLAQLSMVDTRQYRDVLVTDPDDRHDPQRTMLGPEQEQWLLDGLGRSDATWNVVGNQVFMMQADHTDGPEERWGLDPWDGYAAARQRLFDGVRDRGVENFVILTGDAHRSVAADLKIDFNDSSSATIGSEFLGTSISSGRDGQPTDGLGEIWLRENPHMKFHNSQRGYVRCEVSPETWRTDYRIVPYVSQPGAPLETAARVHLEAGVPGIQQVDQ